MAFDFTKISHTWRLKSKISLLSLKWLTWACRPTCDHCIIELPRQEKPVSEEDTAVPVVASPLTSLYVSHVLTDKRVHALVSLNIDQKREKKKMNSGTSWGGHGFKGSPIKPAHFAAEVGSCYFFGRKYSFFVSIEAKQGTCFFPMALASRELPTLLIDTFLLTRVSSSVNSREFPNFRSSSHRSWTYQEPFKVSRWE